MKGTYIGKLLGSFKKFNISTSLFSTFLLLTIAMGAIGNIFDVKNHLTHPQFTEHISTAWFLETIDKCNLFLYKLFFIIDFIWAPLLLWILFKIINWKTKTVLKGLKWVPGIFAILAIASLVLDYIENIKYLTTYQYPKDIAILKIVCYASAVFIFTVVCLLNFKTKWFIILRNFVRSSWISLLILFVLGMALPKVPQFNSVIVDLYYRPIQFSFVFLALFAPLYAIVLSHYPSYISLSALNQISVRHWRMTDKFWLFGTIWYKERPHEGKEDVYKSYQSVVGYLRRSLGILFYSAIFFLLAFTADTNFDCGLKFAPFTMVLIIFLLLFLNYHRNKYATWEITNKPFLNILSQQEAMDIYKSDVSSKQTPTPDASLFSINKPIKAYVLWVSISVALLIWLFISLYMTNKDDPYSWFNVILSLSCLVAQSISYVYYRTYRSAFKYVFFDPNQKAIFYAFGIVGYDADRYQEYKSLITEFFKNYDFKNGSKLLRFFSKLRFFEFSFGSLSNHIVFLKRIIYLGFLNAIVLLVLNYFNLYTVALNSTLIILSYFFLFYGIFVIIIKHIIYYSKSEEVFARNNKIKFKNSMLAFGLMLFVLIGLARFNTETKSELYVLKQIDTSDEVPLRTYVEHLEYGNRFYIGCYGGGMKANAWTMTVLDSLNKGFNIMEKATCLSGASGGTIGLTNYTTIYSENNTEAKRSEIVRKIATEDILSIDLTHVLGRDLVGHLFIPRAVCDLKGTDRSTAAMKKYAKLTNFSPNHSFETLTYRGYWKTMYEKKKHKLPILIANSTNIEGRQGMAVSIKTKDEQSRILYTGADDILELDNSKTLSYFNATSTTNRFPLISPAATIKGKGQYNDGGIYENSGLLSAYKLYQAIESIDDTISAKNVFVNIVNDKNLFIKAYIQDQYSALKNDSCFGDDINESSEMSAILKSVSATEMFPSYIKEKLEYLSDYDKCDITFISIYLPHRFDLDDIKTLYKPEIVNAMCVNELDRIITKNKDDIKDCYNRKADCLPIVEPELSRVMAKPAHDFMLAMLKHPYVKKDIDELGKLLSEN